MVIAKAEVVQEVVGTRYEMTRARSAKSEGNVIFYHVQGGPREGNFMWECGNSLNIARNCPHADLHSSREWLRSAT